MRLINFRIPAAIIGLTLLIGGFADSASALPNGTYVAQAQSYPTTPSSYQTSPPRRPVKRCRKTVRNGQVYQQCWIVYR
jgi:hypothetical protein